MNLRVVGITTLCLAMTAPLIGQGRENWGAPTPLPGIQDGGARNRAFPGPGERNPLGRIEDALDLTASQVASLEALVAERQAGQENVRQEMEASRTAFEAAVEARDATAIGTAFLARLDFQEELRRINEDYRTRFRSLLTVDQQGRLDALEAFGGRREGLGGRAQPPFRGR